jgi:hypothetical protein
LLLLLLYTTVSVAMFAIAFHFYGTINAVLLSSTG